MKKRGEIYSDPSLFLSIGLLAVFLGLDRPRNRQTPVENPEEG